jgi:asparaginyl-tRNA synthetase
MSSTSRVQAAGAGVSLVPPASWRRPAAHFRTLLADPWYGALVRLLDCVQRTTHSFYASEGLVSAALPVTTGSISSPMGLGSDSLPVAVEIMGVRTYLADSAQFMLELMCRTVGGGVYYFMPSFRGEATDATHLSQFYHSEIEVPGTLGDIIEISERYVRALSAALLNDHGDLIRASAGGVEHLEQLLAWPGAFPRLRNDVALTELKGDPRWTTPLATGVMSVRREGEAELARRFGIGGSILWLTHFDAATVPFYQAQEPGTRCAENADLLIGGRETIGAGQRHADRAQVAAALASHRVSGTPYDWYLEMREIAPLQTAGMGMGVERFLMWATQQSDIRDFMPLLRENGVDHLP